MLHTRSCTAADFPLLLSFLLVGSHLWMVVATVSVAVLLVAVVRASIGGDTQIHRPYSFPLYKQCDPVWGNDTMGVKGDGWRSTICVEGCAMTSVTMALAGLGVKSPIKPPEAINPKEFNNWLIAHRGYVCLDGDCDNLNLTAPEAFSVRMSLIGETEKPSYGTIVNTIKDGSIIHVAHVRNKTHFVLLTWPDSRQAAPSFLVNDPFYSVDTYLYDDISDIISFHVNPYPLYSQCDPRWGNNDMGLNNQTICEVGCLMSSVSMAIAGNHIPIDGRPSDPATLNQFLRTHDGYTPGSALRESIVPHVAPKYIVWPTDGMHLQNDIPFSNITDYLDRSEPRIVIANVMHGQHYVLVVGYRADGDTLVVNDPGFPGNEYSYKNDVVGWRLFDMKRFADPR